MIFINIIYIEQTEGLEIKKKKHETLKHENLNLLANYPECPQKFQPIWSNRSAGFREHI